MAASPACSVSVGITDIGLIAVCRRVLGGKDDVAVVREDDRLSGTAALHGSEQLGGRGVHRAAAVDDVRAEALEQERVAGARDDGDERAGLAR